MKINRQVINKPTKFTYRESFEGIPPSAFHYQAYSGGTVHPNQNKQTGNGSTTAIFDLCTNKLRYQAKGPRPLPPNMVSMGQPIPSTWWDYRPTLGTCFKNASKSNVFAAHPMPNMFQNTSTPGSVVNNCQIEYRQQRHHQEQQSLQNLPQHQICFVNKIHPPSYTCSSPAICMYIHTMLEETMYLKSIFMIHF